MNNDLPVSLLVAAFTGAVMLLLPHISPRRYFFAITVPPGFPSSPAGRTSLRRYYSAVVCSIVISVVTLLELDHWSGPLLPVVAMLAPSILGMLAYLCERYHVA